MANQDRKATALYIFFAAQASNIYHDFYNTLDIKSKNKDSKSAVFFKIEKCDWFLKHHSASLASKGLKKIHIYMVDTRPLANSAANSVKVTR